MELRRHLLWVLRQVREVGSLNVPDDVWRNGLDWVGSEAAKFDSGFRHRIFSDVRNGQLNNL